MRRNKQKKNIASTKMKLQMRDTFWVLNTQKNQTSQNGTRKS